MSSVQPFGTTTISISPGRAPASRPRSRRPITGASSQAGTTTLITPAVSPGGCPQHYRLSGPGPRTHRTATVDGPSGQAVTS